MTDKELRELLGNYGVDSPAQFVKDLSKQQKVEIKGLLDPAVMNQPTSYGYDPVQAPYQNLGMNPNQQDMAMRIFQGSQPSNMPVSLMGGGNTMLGGGMKGNVFGGRLGAEMNLSPEQQLALGITGGGSRLTYGMGQPYEGQANRSDIMGVDATIRNLKANEEYGAAYQKDPRMNPFLSMFYRKRF
jgi:hypothetical protein